MRKSFPIYSKHFGDRLEALMGLHNLNTPLEFAIKLAGYTDKPKSNTSDYVHCKSREKTIKNHLRIGSLSEQNSSKSIASCFIAEYCEFFNCSADYFFGYIDYPTQSDTDIIEETGLSLTSITTLKFIKDNQKNSFSIIDFLLSRDDYIDKKIELFNLIHLYISSSIIKNYLDDDLKIHIYNKDEIIFTDDYGNPINTLPIDEAGNTFLFSINKVLQELKNAVKTFGLIGGKRKPISTMLENVINNHKIIENNKYSLKTASSFELDSLLTYITHFNKQLKIDLLLLERKYTDELNKFDFSKFSDEDIKILQYYKIIPFKIKQKGSD